MRTVAIEDPVINSPFDEPKRHFRFDDEGITNEIVAGSYSSPARSRRNRARRPA